MTLVRLIRYWLFLISNVRRLITFYNRIVFSSIIALAISFGTNLLEDFAWTSGPWRPLYLSLRYAPPVLLAVLIFTEVVISIVTRLRDKGITVECLVLNAHYSTNGRYTLEQNVVCRNEGTLPIKEVPDIKEGYHEEPSEQKLDFCMLDENSHRSLGFTEPAKEVRNINSSGLIRKTFRYVWKCHVEPPLEVNEVCKFFVRISALGVERAAFSKEGTTFAWAPTVDTREIEIAVRAPSGFKVILIAYDINDENGTSRKPEIRRCRRPRVIFASTVLFWSILLPRRDLRYTMCYRFDRIIK